MEGPTPHIIAYFINVCNFVGPAKPKLIGKSIFSLSSISNHFITGLRSKQNWVVIPTCNFVRRAKSCFIFKAFIVFSRDPSLSMSGLPSGWPAICIFLNEYFSNIPLSNI